MASLTLSTLGLGITLAWGALALFAVVLRVRTVAKGEEHAASPASLSFRYRTLVLAWLGAAAMLALPSLREASGALTSHPWQPEWPSTWPAAEPLHVAVDWVRPWVAASAWSESPVGRFLTVVAIFWAFLASVSLARHIVAHVRLMRTCRRATEAPDVVRVRAAIVARRLAMTAPVLLVSDETDTPFATGFLSPRIVLPRAGLAAFSTEQLDFVLHHEMVHIERGDLRVALLVDIARLVFTAHPLQHAFLSEIAWAREASVDARVAADAPLQYASFLLELARRMSMGTHMKGTLPMADSTDSKLHRRIALILSRHARAAHASTRIQRRAAAFLAVAGVGLAAGVWFAPTSWAAPSLASGDHCDAGARADLAAQAATPLPVDMEARAASPIAASTQGQLPQEVIQKTVREKFPELKRCYETLSEPKPSVRLELHFTIDTEGKVSDGHVDAEAAP
ncbi:MAG TPA: M56 family metallopeptidase, partial [Polyangiaceae bacterium]|nr:M56 family metallopeptidase [Polyangiaceae bacterium]